MAKSFDLLFDDIMPSLPGCGTDLVRRAIRRTAQDFFRRTRAWKVAINDLAVVVGESEITITPDLSSQEVVRIEAAWWNGVAIGHKSLKALDNERENWTVSTGTPECLTQLSPTIATLIPSPSEAGSIMVRVAVAPSDRATSLPDELMAEFSRALIDGAKAAMFMLPKKPWSDYSLGGLFQQAYEQAVASATYRAAIAFGDARIPARPSFC